ncbi:hypothetical protein J6590_022281 [Homalodisca vitripennis]|nr:hypothetical protein J6590_022281 [Homalodisca vitripennis]
MTRTVLAARKFSLAQIKCSYRRRFLTEDVFFISSCRTKVDRLYSRNLPHGRMYLLLLGSTNARSLYDRAPHRKRHRICLAVAGSSLLCCFMGEEGMWSFHRSSRSALSFRRIGFLWLLHTRHSRARFGKMPAPHDYKVRPCSTVQ